MVSMYDLAITHCGDEAIMNPGGHRKDRGRPLAILEDSCQHVATT